MVKKSIAQKTASGIKQGGSIGVKQSGKRNIF
jgi:hypothetical protein